MKKTIIYIIPVIIIMAGIFYYLADPQKSIFMPKCPLKMLTGWQCPSCGAQRAVHAFLHGNFCEAISYNFFFIIAIPFFLLTVYSVLMRKRNKPSNTTIKLYDFTTNRYTLLAYIVVFFLWWIIRNLIGC